MRAITKMPEPTNLTQHRNASHSNYDNYQEKDELRQALVQEQLGLCCYCLERIQPDISSIKIEHWKCQDSYPNEQLDYDNLLGACKGGEGKPYYLQHCDTRKGNKDLKWNPANPGHAIEARIFYKPDGTIASDDSDFNEQLNEVLNLNLQIIKNNRRSILLAIIEWWKKEKSKLQGPVPPQRILNKINKYACGNGHLAPYSPVAVWWLKKKLR